MYATKVTGNVGVISSVLSICGSTRTMMNSALYYCSIGGEQDKKYRA